MRNWESQDKGGYIFVYKMVLGARDGEKFVVILIFFFFFLNSSLKYEQFYGVILCSFCASSCFHTFNSFLPAEMPTFELQTNLYFYFLVFKKKKEFNSQWVETLLFHSVAGKHGIFLSFFCDVLDKLWKVLQRTKQSREGSLSAQHYCKYLGPQLSHSFTTVETCQATKNCKTNVI